jgi:hypothetical protein
LERIGILKLVDQDMLETPAQGLANLLMITQQITSGKNQVVEVELSAVPFVVSVTFEDGFRGLDKGFQRLGSSRLKQGVPGISTDLVVPLGVAVELLSFSHRQASFPGGLGPFA